MLMNLFLSVSILASVTAGPPPARIEPVTETMHGTTIVDNYRWLEALEADSEEVKAWTTAQNDYTRSILDNLPGRKALEERLGQLMSVGSVGAPRMRGNLYFYTERKGDQNQPILYLREGYDGEPQVLIDPNTLDDTGLYSLGWFAPNHDGSLLAFSLYYAGDEMHVLYVMDVASRKWLADEITGKVEFGGWTPDSKGFVYGKLEDPADAYSRSFRYHELGRHQRHDPLLVMQEKPTRIPQADLSEDGRWIIVFFFEGWSKQDVYAVDVAEWQRTGEFRQVPIAVGLEARFAPQIVHGDTLYLFTTLDAPNGILYAVDLLNPARENWKVIIPERKDAVLGGVSHARGMLVASYDKNATSRFERFTMDGAPLGELELPGLGSAGISTRFDRREAYFSFASYNEPNSIYRVDLTSGKRSLWARPEVPVDPDTVIVKQEWCTSKDGTRVPMFIVHRKGLKKTGDNPTQLYGYGGFNASLTPWFDATAYPWFEAGGVYAIVNLRGGGEFGEAWHQAGMLGRKQNVYDDLYAAAEYLIKEGYTSAQHLAVRGGSNGGLLTGVAAIQRPDLWAAVVSEVPLLDMLRYHHFLMAKFWTPEYGDPDDAEAFQWLYAYSPYHHIKKGRKYPAILFTAGENDNRVHPLHARKMVAAMQARAANDFENDPILLWVDRSGGHGFGKPLSLRIRERADWWIFIMWKTGMRYGE